MTKTYTINEERLQELREPCFSHCLEGRMSSIFLYCLYAYICAFAFKLGGPFFGFTILLLGGVGLLVR